jgi:hypothetical protein
MARTAHSVEIDPERTSANRQISLTPALSSVSRYGNLWGLR